MTAQRLAVDFAGTGVEVHLDRPNPAVVERVTFTGATTWAFIAAPPALEQALAGWLPVGWRIWRAARFLAPAENIDERWPARLIAEVRPDEVTELVRAIPGSVAWRARDDGTLDAVDASTPEAPAAEQHGSLLRVPHTSGSPLFVEELRISNIFSGYLEGGPGSRRIFDTHFREGRELGVPVCVRWDPSLRIVSDDDLRAAHERLRDIVEKVPPWLCTARVFFDDAEERRARTVAWLSAGVDARSLEELLLEGLADVDLHAPRSTIVWRRGDGKRLTLTTADGVFVRHTALAFRFADGNVHVSTTLRGPERPGAPPAGEDQIAETRFGWRVVLEPGNRGLDDVLASAARDIPWSQSAHDHLEDWD